MSGAASQAGDADSSWESGLTSGFQGSVDIPRGALLLVPQWQCISSYAFYILNLMIITFLRMNVFFIYIYLPVFDKIWTPALNT